MRDVVRKSLGVALVGLLMSGCWWDSRGEPPPCTPPDLNANITSEPSSVGQSHVSDVLWSELRVYLDGSGSMQGFVKPTSYGAAHFSDFLVNLPQLPGGQPGAARTLFRVGPVLYKSSNLAEELGVSALAPAYYTGPKAQDGDLSAAFKDAFSLPADGVAIFISDLFFSGSELTQNSPNAVIPLLGNFLAQGKAVAIYGIENSFLGMIYDLPSAPPMKSGQLLHNGRRPFFVIVAAKPELIDKIDEYFRTGPLMNATDWHRALYLQPTFDRSKPPLILGPQPPIRHPNDSAANAHPYPIPVPNTIMPWVATLKPQRTQPTYLGYEIPDIEAFVLHRHGVIAKVRAITRVWQALSDQCTARKPSWRLLDVNTFSDLSDFNAQAELHRTSEHLMLRVTLPAEASGIPPRRYFLVSVRVQATALAPPPPENWMQAWTLTPQQAMNVPQLQKIYPTGSLFPVLNLELFQRNLTSQAYQNLAMAPIDIANVSLILERAR